MQRNSRLPSSAPILYYFARSQADLPAYPSENALNAVKLAVDYSGDFAEYKAELLVRADHYDEALAIIGKWPEGLKEGPGKSAVTAIVSGLKANKPKEEILTEFATFEKALDGAFATGVPIWRQAE